jgi:hypothetical protein
MTAYLLGILLVVVGFGLIAIISELKAIREQLSDSLRFLAEQKRREIAGH